MNVSSRRFALVFALFALSGVAAQAAPTLDAVRTDAPTEVRPGEPVPLSAVYKEAQGDKPTSLVLVVETPGGETASFPAQDVGGDPVTGMTASWQYKPEATGTYRYHFVAKSPFGDIRDPATDEYQFVSVNLLTKYIILGIGILVALGFLPFVVYTAARGLNRHGDPSAAARVALLIGVLASYALFIYLFFGEYQWLGVAIGAVAALALLIILFSRRRAV